MQLWSGFLWYRQKMKKERVFRFSGKVVKAGDLVGDPEGSYRYIA